MPSHQASCYIMGPGTYTLDTFIVPSAIPVEGRHAPGTDNVMLMVLSPAKSLDFETRLPESLAESQFSQPGFLAEAGELMNTLRELTPEDLSSLMKISSKLGELNFERNHNWHTPFSPDNARQALFAFTGDVYAGLEARTLSADEVEYAQDHLRILSGLYGLLRPLDLMQAYRLEMGTSLKHGTHGTLYSFWGDKLAERLNKEIAEQKAKALLNLASQEYFRAVNEQVLTVPVISPIFRDYKNGNYKIISFYAKKARGMMAAWVIRNRIQDPDALKGFDVGGYRFNAADSTATEPVFLRKQE